MSDLKIPNLNNRSRQYLFKNKLTIKRKSKSRLLRESLFMFISAFTLVYLNFLIPQKEALIYSFVDNVYKIFVNFLDSFKYFFQIVIVIFIVSTIILSGILIIGAIYRLCKVFMRKTKKFDI